MTFSINEVQENREGITDYFVVLHFELCRQNNLLATPTPRPASHQGCGASACQIAASPRIPGWLPAG